MMPVRLVRHRAWLRAWVCACVLVLAGLSGAAAQFPPAPGQSGAGGVFPPPPGQSSAFPPPPGQGQAPPTGGISAAPGGGPSEAQRVCLTFPALREDVEKGAGQIRAASDRKATREEVCPLFKSFAAKEAKMVKFLETNRTLCGVPPQVIGQVKTSHSQTIRIRNQVCSAGPAGQSGPTLSDALGGPVIADDTASKQPGRGTFDTLTGNVLSR